MLSSHRSVVRQIAPFYGRGEGTLALETLGWRGRLQGFRRRNEEKTFTLGGSPQAMIQADKGLTARLPLDPHERRGQSQPIRCTQGVPLEGVRGVVPDSLTGEDLRPGSGEARQKRACSSSLVWKRPSRRRRAKADQHSTMLPHQTIISVSSARTSLSHGVQGSSRQSGMMAEASQNFIGLSRAPPSAYVAPAPGGLWDGEASTPRQAHAQSRA